MQANMPMQPPAIVPMGAPVVPVMTQDMAAARMQAAFRANQAREEVELKKAVDRKIDNRRATRAHTMPTAQCALSTLNATDCCAHCVCRRRPTQYH